MRSEYWFEYLIQFPRRNLIASNQWDKENFENQATHSGPLAQPFFY